MERAPPESKVETRKKHVKKFVEADPNYRFLREVAPHKIPPPPSVHADVSTRGYAGLLRLWKIRVHAEAERIRRETGLPPPQRSYHHFPYLSKKNK